MSDNADAKMLRDLMGSGLTESEALDALGNIRKLRKEKEQEVPTGPVNPSFPSKKATPVVKMARKGGKVKSIDGCAIRGKTRAKQK